MRFYRVFESSQSDDLDSPPQPAPDSMLKFPLALKTGIFKARHPLKGCPECLAKDIVETGLPYWRLAHQFPGVWVCLEHDHGLREVVPSLTRAQTFVWQTPTETALREASDAFDHPGAFASLKALTQLILSITSEKEHGIQRLAERAKRLRRHLKDAGLLNPSGRLKLTRRHEVAVLCESFAAYCSVLRNHPQLSTLPGTADGASRLLRRFVLNATLAAPLERLVITAWIDKDTYFNHG